ncbi:MAG: response regulator [Phaeodactylibacter sp.]|nr:response regulator [Phaeodactylibacter sp.]
MLRRLQYSRLLFSGFLLFHSVILAAQPSALRFERLNVEEGFVNAGITTIFQDSRGFMWLGGLAGLTRYDGYDAVSYVYDPADSLSIGDHKANVIIESRDSGIWIGAQNGLHYFNREKETFTRFLMEADSHVRSVFGLCEDDSGRLWALTPLGIYILEPHTWAERKLDVPNENEQYRCIHKAKDGTIWVGTTGGLYSARETDQGIQMSPVPVNLPGPGYPQDKTIRTIAENNAGSLWLGVQDGVIRYDPTLEEAVYIPLQAEKSFYVYAIHIGRDGLVWCATVWGLFRIDSKTLGWRRFQSDRNDNNSLISNSIYDIYEDRSGIIWISTKEGINLFKPFTENFRGFPNDYQYEMGGVAQLRGFFEISPGKLLLWEDGQLMIFDWQRGTKTPFPHSPAGNPEAWHSRFLCFFRDNRDRIWMGTEGGVFVFNSTTNQFTHYHRDAAPPFALSSNFIRDIYQDHTGAIWVTTWRGGTNCINAETGEVSHLLDTSAKDSRSHGRTIFEDRNGTVWIGTRGGLFKYDRENKQFIRYHHDPNDSKSISENTAFDLYEDEQGSLWIGTYGGGLNLFDPDSETFTHFTVKDGLPDNNILSIFPDGRGNLWMSTFTSIVKFDPETKTFTGFNHRDGLLNRRFSAFSHYQSPYSGHLIYEGHEGIDIFHPDSLVMDSVPPIVQITDLQLFNRSFPIRRGAEDAKNGDFYLSQSITETKELALPYRMKVITFKFAALHFANPKKNKYAYKLEGFDEGWQDIGNRRTATFTNLPPGKYRFRVKAYSAYGVESENEAALALSILPPWWLTWWAYALYILAALAILYGYLSYQRRRWRLQSELEAQQREAQRLQELDSFKSRLYANITHEFRTPLTVIMGLTEEIPAYHQKEETSRLQQAVELVRRNSARVLQLINQMLGLARIEAGMMDLDMKQGDVIAFLKYLTESHESLAAAKKIALSFEASPAQLVMDYDEEKLYDIFSNLVSNAIKFTGEGGKVSVKAGVHKTSAGEFLALEVSDTGIGIPEDQQERIFERFYQASPSPSSPSGAGAGAGIGLTLVKELVTLLGGKIEVESEPGSGARFTVQLPVSNDAPLRTAGAFLSTVRQAVVPPAKSSMPEPAREEETTDSGLPTLLIVEDSPDIVTYLKSCLEGQYDILAEPNGRLGVGRAIEAVPDIIISDVMMPEMDGFELCEILKNDERTSHIPIVLLTAKATIEDRITGLKRGADAYLPKPFNKEELLVRLEKLVQLRAKLQERYASLAPPSPPEDPALQLEDEFVQKVLRLVEENLNNEHFGGQDIADQIFLSRTQVHRKLKALTGKSTGHFIRTVRLHKARKLLQSGATTVKEAAYDVGFTDPAYFSRVFSEEFGHPPSFFLKS